MRTDSATPTDRPTYATAAMLSWRHRTEWPLMAVSIGSLPILLLELRRSELPMVDRAFITAVNIAVLIVFAADYIVGLLLASSRRSYVRGEVFGLALVLAQAVALAPVLAPVGALRALRAIPAVRLVAVVGRGIALGGIASRDGRRILREHAGAVALGTAALTWITSAVGFTLAEDVGENGRVHSFFDALWWSLSTITTVGYGDIFPITAAGRVIGGLTMLVGISTFALVTAKVAQFLVRSDDGAGGG